MQRVAHNCARGGRLANPDHIELLSFRRTFTLLILLVVVPSAGLSGFGVVAIVNERAAVEKRIEAVWATRVAAVSQGLRRSLDGAHLASAEPLRLEVDTGPLTDTPFRVEGGEIGTADPRLEGALRSVRAVLGALPERPVAFSVLAPQGTYLLAAMRHGEVVSGAVVSPYAVERLLEAEGAKVTPPSEPARFALEPVQREAPEGVLARLVSGVSEVREALGPRELAGATLPAPLQDFRVVAFAVGEDPVAETSSRNRWLYGILLGVFYITLAVGVIITGRALYREARLSRMKTDFVSLVSHELRTPLTSIRMFIEMLALNRVKEPAEMQTVLDLLSTETARLSAMIESVLDWARIESGRQRYALVRLAPREVVEAAATAFKATRLGAAMELTVSVPADLPAVDADKDAIAGALLNLLQNAFKYTGERKRIDLRASSDGREVVLEVQDNGMGIERRDLKKIFDRFFRADNLLTRATEGTGLGLSIAQRIVKAHGGRITVDSVVGKGSTFRIHLPVGDA